MTSSLMNFDKEIHLAPTIHSLAFSLVIGSAMPSCNTGRQQQAHVPKDHDVTHDIQTPCAVHLEYTVTQANPYILHSTI